VVWRWVPYGDLRENRAIMGLQAYEAVPLWVDMETGHPCDPVAWCKTP